MPPILKIVWFFLPAAAANMAPVFVRNFPPLSTPVDFGRNIFGNNKTWRGIFFGVITAIVVALIQHTLVPEDSSILESTLRGLLLGIGALGGDLLKSFFKRRIGIPSGKSWPVADQIDWILGVLAVTAVFYGAIFSSWPLETLAIILVLFGSLHILTNIAGYFLGMRKQPI
ncbi:MAG: CDP-archaeol synthase [Patescibacteria group bacterium]